MSRETLHPPGDAGPGPRRHETSDTPRLELWLGLGLIGLFFFLFLGWAAVAPLDAGVIAQGQIEVSGHRQVVQHREGGVMSALHVREGDRVREGQILLQLGSGDLRAVERGVTGQVFALFAQKARLMAERDNLGAVPTPAEFVSLSPNDKALADASLALQRQQFMARRMGRATQSGVLGQRTAQLNEQIVGYQQQIAATLEQRRLIQEELAGMRSLAERGYAPLTRIRALERTAAQVEGELGSLRAQIARSREAVGESRLQMAGVGIEMNEEVSGQLQQVEVQLNELRPRMEELRAQIARSEVRAPVSGQIVGLAVFTPGGVIQPGQTLMEIVPQDTSQVIVARISPIDVNNLVVGQSTEVRFPGLRGSSRPIVRGRLTKVSADSFTNEQTGSSFFRAEIIVPPDELKKLGRSEAASLRPGAPAEVVILLRKRTALAYLLEPLANNLWRAGSTR